MAMLCVLLFVSLVCALHGRVAEFIVAPQPLSESCNISDADNCFSLRQVSKRIGNVHFADLEYLTLIFLPGTHIAPNQLVFADKNRVSMQASNTHHGRAEIKCPGKNSLIYFNDVKNLTLSSIQFSSCRVEVTNGNPSAVADGGRPDHAFIDNCLFNATSLSCVILGKLYILYINNTVFMNSTRDHIGGALSVYNVDILQLKQCHFVGNSGSLGGAIYSDSSRVIVLDYATFRNNSASEGGAMYLLESSAQINNSYFIDNRAIDLGGAIHFNNEISPNNLNLEKFLHLGIVNTTFTSNQAEKNGGGLYCGHNGTTSGSLRHVIITKSRLEFNLATNGGFAFLLRCTLKVLNNAETQLVSNRATNGGAIYAQESVLTFDSEAQHVSRTYIGHNVAEAKGGALFLNRSRIPLQRYHFNVVFEHNAAIIEGGAIFNEDSGCQFGQCFFTYSTRTNLNEIFFTFLDNVASRGSVLFGGLLDRCIFDQQASQSAMETFKQISQFEFDLGSGEVTSEPLRVCMCYDSQPNCSLNEVSFSRMRGQHVTVSVAALDQDGNPVSSIITASFRETLSAELRQGERSREIFTGNCSNLSYHVFATESTSKVALLLESLENPCLQSRSESSAVTIDVTLTPCSRGFEQQGMSCVCDSRLSEHFNISHCDIDTQSVHRQGHVWLRYDEMYLQVHPNCPLDYCQVTQRDISLTDPDDQCANGRTGVLCGGCPENYSVSLGGSKCKDCTSTHNFIWLTLVLAVLGMALVAFLLVCNITISAGTLNGLVLYANIVSTSGVTTLHNCSISPLLSIFVAWVNLDLGIETCFSSGMDTYQKTWLQFVFPLYIWLLVVAIIVASYYSTTAMKLFGRNNIAILSTLFLLSYSKLLKTITAALSGTHILRSSADNVSDDFVAYRVWTHDGNIEYLKGKHVALFTAALLVLILLFLPYTLLLIFGQCVRSISGKRCRWVLKIIRSTAFVSVLDAYHAPYKRKHRYWTGLVLLVRCVLFILFATNPTTDALLTNMFIVTLLVILILLVKILTGNVYKSFHVEFLELLFLLNLGFLSATLYYVGGRGDGDLNMCTVTTVSFSASFVGFIGIVIYHTSLRIVRMEFCARIKHTFLKRWPVRQTSQPTGSTVLDSINLTNVPPTSTTVDLREQLLESVH